MHNIPQDWTDEVKREMKKFALKNGTTYSKPLQILYALFEISCFHALIRIYESKGCTVKATNLDKKGVYKYLTTPNGNPDNFSYVTINNGEHEFEIRQQLRIISHINKDIAFTPDIVVIRANTKIMSNKDKDYANGKRNLFGVESKNVLAAHECKSLSPFPELLISFIGMLITGHKWASDPDWKTYIHKDAIHPAPTLFIGGSARPFQLRLITALQDEFPININVGLHAGVAKFATNMKTFISPEIK